MHHHPQPIQNHVNFHNHLHHPNPRGADAVHDHQHSRRCSHFPRLRRLTSWQWQQQLPPNHRTRRLSSLRHRLPHPPPHRSLLQRLQPPRPNQYYSLSITHSAIFMYICYSMELLIPTLLHTGQHIGSEPTLPYLSPQLTGQRLLIGANFASAGIGILNDTGFQFVIPLLFFSVLVYTFM